MLQLTPTTEKASRRRKEFHAEIARRARLVSNKSDGSYSIPNTPYGVPKVPPAAVVQRARYVPPAYSYCWCFDLVRFGERYLPSPIPQKRIRIQDILNVVAEYYEVRVADILSARRTAIIVLPRQIVIYLCKMLTPHSYPQIAARIGNRDHSTAISAFRKIERLIRTDLALKSDLEALAATLGGRLA